jgi:sulfate transport system ATP-binding protein
MEVLRERNGTNAIAASVVQIQTVGPNVRLKLKRADNQEFLEAEFSKERQRELGLAPGELIFVRPRHVRVFITDPAGRPINYQI